MASKKKATAPQKQTGKATSTNRARKKTGGTRRTRAPRQQSVLSPGDVCFVMSPFGGWYDKYYAAIYCPAIEAAGLAPRRADDLYRPSAIVQDIWTYVREAKVMLADLTEKNPNVFYELGLAHALSKPVVLLSQTIEDVPFDLRALRVITYDTAEPEWAENLRNSISNALAEVLRAPTTAVLQPFQTQRPPSASSAEEKRDAMVQQLMREVNLLRAEMLGSRRQREIEPSEARRLIRRYLEQGIPTEMIIDRLQPLGPPASWIRDEVEKMQGGMKKQTSQVELLTS